MATQKNQDSTSSKSAKSSGGRRALKTAVVLAAVGAATLAVAKGLKTPRGRALKKKAMTKGRKVMSQLKSSTQAGSGRGTGKSKARAR